MINFQRSYELEEQQIPNTPSPQNLIITSSNLPTIESGCKRQRRSASVKEEQDHEGSLTEHKLRKIKHREIERQRRQEMANLHASLRSLLPVEYIKGKRSISDHMQGTVNYIKHMQNKIKEVRSQKEKLIMKIPDLRTKVSEIVRAKNYSHSHLRVTASICRDGLEILISSRQTKDVVFPLSRVIKKLIVEGLDVISCVSTRNYETTFYRILNQVDNPSCIDITALQEKLADVINQDSASE